MPRRWSAVVCAWTLLAMPLATRPAVADGQAPPSAVPVSPALATPGPPPITGPQLEAFVELTREPKEWVWYRLVNEPALVPYAVAAADARIERRVAGSRRAAAGAVILTVGTSFGFALWARGLAHNVGCGDSRGCSADRSARFGLPLLVGSVIGGLAALASTSKSGTSRAEYEAMLRYRTPPPSPAATSNDRTPRLLAPTLSLPLLSGAF